MCTLVQRMHMPQCMHMQVCTCLIEELQLLFSLPKLLLDDLTVYNASQSSHTGLINAKCLTIGLQ